MGTKMVILALLLLLPATVSAEAEDGNEDGAAEACPPLEITSNPTGISLHPECVRIPSAEESK